MAEKHTIRKAVCLLPLLAIFSGSAGAQVLRGLPSLPVVNGLPRVVNGVTNDVLQTTDRTLGVVRDVVGRPQSAARHWEHDPAGAPVVRDEILALASSSEAIAAARAQSFEVVRTETIEPLGISLVVLRPPEGLSLSDAIARLRAADPQGQYDYNHIYNPTGTIIGGASSNLAPQQAPERVGMVDGGVDRSVYSLRGLSVESAGFVGSCKPVPSDHGTAVAFLLSGARDNAFRPETLYAADVYCGHGEGGSAEAIVRALGWLSSVKVPVVNISLAGPPNALLAAGVKAFLLRGHVLVAAVGNDGPSANPRYPAAYPGVIAVTAVDSAHRIALDANQGDYIAFAALGVKVPVPKAGGGTVTVSGTSFAAPLVTRRFAVLLSAPDQERAAWALCELRTAALDLGTPGRDPIYGYGFLEGSGTMPVSSSCGMRETRQ